MSNLSIVLFVSLLAISSGFDWSKRFPTSNTTEMLHWGTYKSDRIHGITEITDPLDSLTISLMLASNLSEKNISNLKYNFLDVQSPSDDESQIYYEYHNGFSFAEQIVEDANSQINVTNTFYKTSATSSSQAWNSLTNVYPYKYSQETVTLFYGIALENYYNNGTRYLDFDPTNGQITIVQPSELYPLVDDVHVGYINYYVYLNGQQTQGEVEIFYQSFSDLDQSDLWQLNNQTILALNNEMISDYYTLSNTVDKHTESTYLVLLQFRVPVADGYSLLITYNSARPTSAPNWNIMQSTIAGFKIEYNAAFEKAFPDIAPQYKSLAKYALNNVIGGIIYYYGPVNITEDPTPQPALPLFTATPTRNSFQRGFLWDEGFHELLICNWSPELCITIIGSWLGTQYKTGWIPREQARGAEILSFVPGAFVAQSDKEGNPPTLMLTLANLLANPSVDQSLKEIVYQTYKDRLYMWWSWFFNSQEVTDESGTGLDLFLWSYKEFEGNIQYFGSGLDDYPRSDPGYISKYHLDLQVWEIIFADAMHTICAGAGDTANATMFANLTETLKSKLPLFIDPSDNLYKDIFQPNNSNSSNPNDTPNVPSSHVGYVSLMPLMFGYVEENTAEFNATLDLIEENGVLWSEYGIISLAKNDSAFEKNSDYWTGPIWINFNYLLLRGFKLYYWDNARVQTLYELIRGAVVGVIDNNYVNTGYIWEHYNLTTGLGQGNHPFTGWSSIVDYILAEDY